MSILELSNLIALTFAAILEATCVAVSPIAMLVLTPKVDREVPVEIPARVSF